MSKDPAVLFYTSDFLSGTMLMSYEEKGQYITLLCLQHQQGHLTEKQLKQITDSETVLSKFILAEDGKFHNLKMHNCTVKRKQYSESRSNNRKGKTNNTSKTHEKDMSNTSKSYDEHMENEIGIEIDTVKETIEYIWSLYPRKEGKLKAVKQIAKLLKQYTRDELVSCVNNFINAKKGTDPKFIPHGSTFFNGTYADYLTQEDLSGEVPTITLEQIEAERQRRDRIKLQAEYEASLKAGLV